MYARAVACVLWIALAAFGQTGPTITGAGYGFAGPIVAPGQVAQLQVTGLKTVLAPAYQQASTLPLPTSLAGISVQVSESVQTSTMGTPVVTTYQAPILSLNQVNLCPGESTSADCRVTYIRVQMPYELTVHFSPALVQTSIAIFEGGVGSQPFTAGVFFDHIHIVTTCEDQPAANTCPQIVTHADGSLVSRASPAQPGETVVLYAWGLGTTLPRVKTGDASPVPAPVVNSGPGAVRFDFVPGAGPSQPYAARATSVPAYLAPGFVGLYQVNVQLPSHFPPVPPCDETTVFSNLTISIGGAASFDGAALCVQPLTAQPQSSARGGSR